MNVAAECSIALALAALAYGAFQYRPHPTLIAPRIEAQLLIKGSGEGCDLPAVDGHSNHNGGHSTTSAGDTWDTLATYRVIETARGTFAVQVHYEIAMDGLKTIFDRTLPVLPKRPAPGSTDWLTIRPNVETAAYFTGGTITYQP